MIQYLIYIMLAVIPLIVFIGMYKTQWYMVKERSREQSRKAVLSLLKEENAYEVHQYNKSQGYFSISQIDKYLTSHGGYYMFKKLDPSSFIIIKFIIALVFFIMCLLFMTQSTNTTTFVACCASLILGIAGFFAFDLLINVSNDSDNEEMIDDIYTIFNVLKIQSKAGVYLSESLNECYLSVKNKRLKEALLEMINKISLKNDMNTAIDEFNEKFENSYIDNLCVTLKQAQTSGQSIKLLNDLSKQIEDMQIALNIRERNKMDTRVQILEVAVFVCLIAIVLVTLFFSLGDSLSSTM